MKYRIFFFLILINIGHIGFAQPYKKAAEKQFLHYTDLIIKKDFRSASDFIIDDLFSIVPKEQMISAMEKIFTLPGFQFSIDSPRVLKVGDSRRIDSAHFLTLEYANILSMKFHDQGDTSVVDTANAESELLTLSLQSKFGEDNVKYDSNTGFYRIYSVKNVIAKSANLEQWKFIVMEEDKMPFLKKIVPPELLK
ncbi:hypothetical protein ABDK00_003385 [Niabella insulamsoli]|uniref:hypothetical protein n=1 Tax=Niabella insulamsoli TaxID=3144874 RepID=UPI0031FD5097